MKKTLKEPKTFNKPRAYMRINGKKKIKNDYNTRIRIIYPDGKAEWADGQLTNNSTWGFYYPCWHRNVMLDGESVMSAKEAVEAMKEYDKKKGYKTLYLGEF